MRNLCLLSLWMILSTSCYFNSTTDIYLCNVSEDSLVQLIKNFKKKHPEENNANLISDNGKCGSHDVYIKFTITGENGESLTFGCIVSNSSKGDSTSCLYLRTVEEGISGVRRLHGKWPTEKSIGQRTLFEKSVMDSLNVEWQRL